MGGLGVTYSITIIYMHIPDKLGKEKKIRYLTYSFRLNEYTYQLLKAKKEESNKSWNLFIYDLITQNYD